MLVQGGGQAGGQAATALKGELEREVEAELGGLEWTTPAERKPSSRKAQPSADGKATPARPAASAGTYTLVRNGNLPEVRHLRRHDGVQLMFKTSML